MASYEREEFRFVISWPRFKNAGPLLHLFEQKHVPQSLRGMQVLQGRSPLAQGMSLSITSQDLSLFVLLCLNLTQDSFHLC